MKITVEVHSAQFWYTLKFLLVILNSYQHDLSALWGALLLYFFIAGQFSQVAQPVVIKWDWQLGQSEQQ